MSQTLLEYYSAIEEASVKMLEAAKEQDWDGVVRYEGACAVLIEQLRSQAQVQMLGADDRQVKARIMQRILLNDARIRDLVDPWVAQIDAHMVSSRPLLH